MSRKPKPLPDRLRDVTLTMRRSVHAELKAAAVRRSQTLSAYLVGAGRTAAEIELIDRQRLVKEAVTEASQMLARVRKLTDAVEADRAEDKKRFDAENARLDVFRKEREAFMALINASDATRETWQEAQRVARGRSDA